MDKKDEKITINFEPISRRVFLSIDKSLYETLVKIGINIKSLCGGLGTCGKCRLLVQKGNRFFNPPTNAEKKFINEKDLEKGYRLACQTRINKNFIQKLEESNAPQFRVFLPDELLFEDFKILTSGINKGVKLNPAIKKIFVEVKKPTLETPIADLERINASVLSNDLDLTLNYPINIEFDLLKKLPKILREKNHGITITQWNEDKIIALEPGNTKEDNFGIAFDIGTTTIVGYLINLNNGKIYSLASKLNPQTAYGEDVITRITYIKDNENGLQTLNSIVIGALNDIILKTCSKAKITPSQIYEATIVGNSVMHHIFLGINPINIGLSPYVPVVQQGLNVKSKNLNLNINSQGNVYVLPLIAGFVGADTMGVIISSDIENENELTLAIDIGTNGEIIIGNNEFLLTGSCAAGSALEGAHIKDGMRAAAGSIDSIRIEPKNLEVKYTTIKNRTPLGICGSGLIDAIAEMLKSNIITRSGNFNKNIIDHERFIKNDKSIEFILVKKDETSLDKDITLTQGDIRQLQMAKAAFYSGARLILKDLNQNNIKNQKDEYEIKQIFLAGAFGNYINKENAKFIGMIPDISNDKIFQIGNAAGIGAQNCLLNKDLRKKAQKLLNKIQYVEIAIKKDFQREYAEAMYFPHLNLDHFPNLKEYENIPKR